MVARLSASTLARLPETVTWPHYERSQVTAGIVHFGVGGFHRAHQALVLDRLMSAGEALDWGIVGVGLLPGDKKMGDVLRDQDFLYTLMEFDPSGGTQTRVIGSHIDYLYGPEDPEAVIALLASPEIRIVSMTITEGGYNYDQVTGEFMWTTPAVLADAEPSNDPTTVFGYLARALKRRFDHGIEPFTVMSCDNIQANGELAKKMVVEFTTRFDAALAAQIDQSVAFPSSMVDRITPVTTDEHRQLALELTGLEDQWPVGAESFFQWVVEDHFPAGRPAFEKADVQVVDDVVAYELMKLRLLNASHQALAYFGHLSGYQFVHEAMADPLITELLIRYMKDEAEPTLQPVPGIDLDEYQATLIARFGNPHVKDTVARLATDASNRIPKWLVPVMVDRVNNGGDVTMAAAVVASWSRYREGVDENGENILINDEAQEERLHAAVAEHDTPLAFVANRAFFGGLANQSAFTEPYRKTLEMLWSVGAQRTLLALVGTPHGHEETTR
jgi:mannitol 2-dehydrogenase